MDRAKPSVWTHSFFWRAAYEVEVRYWQAISYRNLERQRPAGATWILHHALAEKAAAPDVHGLAGSAR